MRNNDLYHNSKKKKETQLLNIPIKQTKLRFLTDFQKRGYSIRPYMLMLFLSNQILRI